MSTRLTLPSLCNDITQKVKIAGQHTLYLSVQDGEQPAEPAIRIERTTCGLRISQNPTSDNLTQQETTKLDTPDVGTDGAGLSCPGSSVVAEE